MLMKLTEGVNFTNILWAAFELKFLDSIFGAQILAQL